jgi:hypothetical protein
MEKSKRAKQEKEEAYKDQISDKKQENVRTKGQITYQVAK